MKKKEARYALRSYAKGVARGESVEDSQEQRLAGDFVDFIATALQTPETLARP